MDQNSVRTLYRRYEFVSNHLEREAYRKQMEGRTKPLIRFNPCEKALVFTAAMADPDGVVTMLVVQQAARTICTCHPGLSESDLWNLYDQATKAIPQVTG